jgi:D-amino peptidase
LKVLRQAPSTLLILAAACFLAPSASAQDKAGLRIFISGDMEGISGVVSLNQTRPAGAEYERFRKFYTDEVLAALKGARAAGATEIVVADSHGNHEGLLIEELPSDVRLIRGSPRPLMAMEGIQEGHFDGVLLVGYHGSAGSVDAVLPHTVAGGRFNEIRLNGKPVSEALIDAAIAGHFGVPVILVTGDEAAIKEVKPVLKGAEFVAVKRGLATYAADLEAPASARARIEAAARRAVEHARAAKPLKSTGPAVLELSFKDASLAELLSWLPGTERVGSRTIVFRAKDIVEAVKFLSFVCSYSAG